MHWWVGIDFRTEDTEDLRSLSEIGMDFVKYNLLYFCSIIEYRNARKGTTAWGAVRQEKSRRLQ